MVSAFLFDTMLGAVMGCLWVMGGNCVILLRRDFLLVAITAVNISTLIFIHHSEGKEGGDQTVFIVYNVQGGN